MDVTRRLPVTIHFPVGTPADEECKLVVRGSYPERGPWTVLGNDTRQTFFELARFRVRDGEEFDVPLPEGLEEMQFDVESRYLFFGPGGVVVDRHEFTRPVELRPKLGGWVTLRLLAPAGYAAPPIGADFARAALEGVDLEIIEGPSGRRGGTSSVLRAHRVTVGRSLAVELLGVDPALTLRLPSSAILTRGQSDLSPFAPPLGWSAKAAAGEHTEATMQLVESVRVAGVILDERGAPIPHAMVEVTTRADDFDWRTTRAANAQGRFDLRGIPGEPLTLKVQKAGYKPTYCSQASLGTDMRIVLLDGLRIAGTVRLPDGTPVVGLQVAISDDESLSGFRTKRSVTDAKGHFAVPATEAVMHTIRARARVDPLGLAKPFGSSTDNPAWELDVGGVPPRYDHELELVMRALPEESEKGGL